MSQLAETTLGETDITVTRLSAGGHFTNGPTGHEDCTRRIGELHHLIDAGITYHDVQWEPEMKVMAEVLKSRHDEITVAWPLHGVTALGAEVTSQYVVDYCRQQRERFGFEHVDILLWIALEMDPDSQEQVMGEMREGSEKVRADGFCDHFGFSCHHSAEMALRAIQAFDDFAVMMVPYSVLHPAAGRELLPLAKSKGVGTVVMKPFGGGEGFFNRVYRGEASSPSLTPFKGSGIPYQAAIKWVLADANVDCTVPGMHSIGEIDELIAASAQPLTADDEAVLEAYRSALAETDDNPHIEMGWG